MNDLLQMQGRGRDAKKEQHGGLGDGGLSLQSPW